MIFTANDVGDTHVDIIDGGRHHVQIRAVATHQHRIAQVGPVKMNRATYQVFEIDVGVIQFEAPVGLASLRFVLLAFFIA